MKDTIAEVFPLQQKEVDKKNLMRQAEDEFRIATNDPEIETSEEELDDTIEIDDDSPPDSPTPVVIQPAKKQKMSTSAKITKGNKSPKVTVVRHHDKIRKQHAAFQDPINVEEAPVPKILTPSVRPGEPSRLCKLRNSNNII